MTDEFNIEMSPNIGNLSWALCQAQKEMHFAAKDASNPFFKSKYADLASVWACCKEPLTKHGISVMQFPCGNGEACGLITQLSWSSDEPESHEWIRCKFVMKPKDNSPQAMGSCLTYMRRYALSAIVGVIADDDDGNAAQVVPKHKDIYKATPEQKSILFKDCQSAGLNIEQLKVLSSGLMGEEMQERFRLINQLKRVET